MRTRRTLAAVTAVFCCLLLAGWSRGTRIRASNGQGYVIQDTLGGGNDGEVFRARPEGAADGFQDIAIKSFTRGEPPGNNIGALGRLFQSPEFQAHPSSYLLPFEGPLTAYLAESPHSAQVPILLMPLAASNSDHLYPTFFSTRQTIPLETRLLRTVRLATQTLKALDDFHALGWVHNDVAGRNLLLTGSVEQFDQGEAHVVLTDDSLATPIGQPPKKGAEGWYPPEAALGEPASATTDYFSLGTTLYRNLFGSIPIRQYLTRWRALRNRGGSNDENDKVLIDLRQHPEVAKDFTAFLNEQFQLFRRQHRLSKRESAAVRYLERLIVPLLSPDPTQRLAARDVPLDPLLQSLVPSLPSRSWTCRLTFGLLK